MLFSPSVRRLLLGAASLDDAVHRLPGRPGALDAALLNLRLCLGLDLGVVLGLLGLKERRALGDRLVEVLDLGLKLLLDRLFELLGLLLELGFTLGDLRGQLGLGLGGRLLQHRHLGGLERLNLLEQPLLGDLGALLLYLTRLLLGLGLGLADRGDLGDDGRALGLNRRLPSDEQLGDDLLFGGDSRLLGELGLAELGADLGGLGGGAAVYGVVLRSGGGRGLGLGGGGLLVEVLLQRGARLCGGGARWRVCRRSSPPRMTRRCSSSPSRCLRPRSPTRTLRRRASLSAPSRAPGRGISPPKTAR